MGEDLAAPGAEGVGLVEDRCNPSLFSDGGDWDLKILKERNRYPFLPGATGHAPFAIMSDRRLTQKMEQVSAVQVRAWPHDVKLGRTNSNGMI